jgi:cell shape-determining protein MreC
MSPTTAQRAYPVTIVLLCVLGLGVPARFLGWTDWIHDRLAIVVAPLGRPLAVAGAWLRGGREGPGDEALLAYEEKVEFLEGELLRQRQENSRLQQVIRDLQSGLDLAKDQPVRIVHAGVYGYSSDPRATFLRVQAGRKQGLSSTSFALAPGLQVVGRVVELAERTCVVRPVTARNGEALAAVIIVKEGDPEGLRCTLAPTGEGTLRGPVEDRRDAAGGVIEPVMGQAVRLNDPTWPAASRMLLVGRVEAVEASPQQPLRKIVTVRPTVEYLDRLSEVVVWTPTGAEGQP